ncbi:MAG TPA: hypothetical protein VNH17_17025 [Streptosporangiaceae bacterium]|nr:hypothetical protein [Streptosporangiaceae bacterium]
MGNYFPVSSPATNYQFTAASPVTGGDPLEFTGTGTGDGQVQRAAAGSRYAGIASADTAPGHALAVYVGNDVFYGPAEGTVTAGDQLAASAVPGRQVKTATPGAQVIGEAFGSAADGAQVHWIQRA